MGSLPGRYVHKNLGLYSIRLDLIRVGRTQPPFGASSLILWLQALPFWALSPITRPFSNLPTVSPVREVNVREPARVIVPPNLHTSVQGHPRLQGAWPPSSEMVHVHLDPSTLKLAYILQLWHIQLHQPVAAHRL